MKNRTILRKEIVIHAVVIFSLIISVFISIKRFYAYKELSFYNQARILAADELRVIEEEVNISAGNFGANKASEKLNNSKEQSADSTGLTAIKFYPYVILDLEGKVLTDSKEFKLKKGDYVNLKEVVQFDNSFYQQNKKDIRAAFLLEGDKKGISQGSLEGRRVSGFVLFLIPRDDIIGKSEADLLISIYLPVLTAVFLAVLLFLYHAVYMKKHIVTPMKEISDSAQAILLGNYDIPVVNIHGNNLNHNEVDELTYGFELMRDKLKENKEKEDQLKRSQKELISCISHDLKTPISTIKAYTEGLRDGLADTPDKKKKYYDILIKKAELLNHMISDLLEHSNAELNELKITKTEHYFLEYIGKLEKDVKELVEQRGFIFDWENKVPDILVSMDENRITQVITNLIDNSMKYTKPKGGFIRIKTEYDSANHEVIISVKDNGNGISTEDAPYVFDLFYRAEKSRTMSIPGSGLGLSICKYIIEQHGGTISLNSKSGEGTEFVFCIKE
ncbi:HAMP domain-containing sensor histidine kinase [Anaerocolumna sp. AGMB13025]|uniref:sensor histidine kinase n=1 Tax=Anaerocolumna sp. AGMB13025 TaxID=3039116 RepID=UPI00241D0533|nr:HAMP domain-containing sensor histidine kinase [Anaerocolumna sp. AGMB13025]WFR56467.1 HAMP domain-containing sensor histidine kinase [Anaerocolumna sp. AGMB13025]